MVLISVRDRVHPRGIVRSGGLSQWKIPVTPSESNPRRSCLQCSYSTNPVLCLAVLVLGMFTKLWKATDSFIMSVRLSLNSAWKISAPTGRIFMTFHISIPFENLSRKFEFNQNLTIMGTALLLNVPPQLLSWLNINFLISAPKMYDVLLLTHHIASTLFHLLFFLHLVLVWYKALFWHSACY